MTITRLAGLLALVAATAVRASAPNDQVTYITGERTTAAFAAGQPLVETSTYKVHASRREAPGMAEIHTLDTDIIYVLDGAATIVTGGKAVGTKETAPHEIRGSAIEGGTPRRLAKGDVFIVPNGVPHWFTQVQSPFLYYVVKVAAASAGGGSQ
jgi:mannose-6-phosphate isomerase-like protein (cupin superfamily)